MKHFILTGAPGSGKTTIIEALARQGFPTIAEAATDVIAMEHARGNLEPWRSLAFIDAIATLQEERLVQMDSAIGAVAFSDRSLICTHALCKWLGYEVPTSLARAIDRHMKAHTFETRVFLIENIGRVEPTAARRISYEDSLAFERVHLESYAAFGFTCVRIAAAPPEDRAKAVLSIVGVTS